MAVDVPTCCEYNMLVNSSSNSTPFLGNLVRVVNWEFELVPIPTVLRAWPWKPIRILLLKKGTFLLPEELHTHHRERETN
jgi:hypothetical protein